jgi:hypothetical protein
MENGFDGEDQRCLDGRENPANDGEPESSALARKGSSCYYVRL